jgi:glycosyltransferase involved in cell wall biosynthesis
MTSFNREKYIKFSIESVLAQSFKNFELIIVDDASTDNTWNIINDYAKIDSRIRVFRNESNLGDYPNRNKAASYATRDYIIFLDSDDVLYIDSIDKCLKIMECNPDSYFGITCSKLGLSHYSKLSSSEAIKKHFFETPILMSGPGGTVHRSKFLRELGFYPIKYGPANDMYHNLKAASYTSIILLPFEISFYRIHNDQESNNKYSYLYNNYNVIKDSVIELPLNLDINEISWVTKKNNRRFVINLIKLFLNKFNLNLIIFAIKKTDFKFRDFVNGIFHLN